MLARRVIQSAIFWLAFAPALCSAQQQRTLLAIFAHPDDETLVAPILARYSREGVKVYIVYATSGDQGETEHARIPAGDSLAAVRNAEAACAAEALGAEPPILLGFPDGGLATFQILVWDPEEPELMAGRMRAEIDHLFGRLRPDVVVTWGPEGSYGHPDYRLISSVVSEPFQELEATRPSNLYFVGHPADRFVDGAPSEYRRFKGVARRFLTVSVSYDAQAERNARNALSCHRSQFTPEAMDEVWAMLNYFNQQFIHFRPFVPRQGDSLF